MFKPLFRKLAERINYDYEKPCLCAVDTHSASHQSPIRETLSGGEGYSNIIIRYMCEWFGFQAVLSGIGYRNQTILVSHSALHFPKKWPA